ncbi:MAG TPA: lysylphosphatidylglycerol synthase transmembrane domain-containing protein [Sandaracinaceae bacterium LLY-WYZ-13_1]|nr:lysylphosphatidylglycerol synthase transmembrane domain-containing protein [Sandaracinaceae bacterium LLY-WYZ-13_1]
MRPPSRRRLLLAAKALVSLGLLGWLGWRMLARDGVDALTARLGTLDAGWLGLAVALHFVAVLAGTARWRLLLRAASVRLPFAFLARSFLIGRFVGAFTPSTTGLDGWRLYEAGKASGEMGRSAAVIGVEKLVGLVGMALVCAALVPFGGLDLMGPAALAAAAAMAAGALIGLWAMGRPDVSRRLAARLPAALRARAERMIDAVADSRVSARTSLRAVGLGVLSHLALSAVFWATAGSLGVTAAPATLLVVGNAIVLAVLLPVSIGGVGVREGVAVVLLASAGVSATDAVLVALLGYLTGQVPALVGGVWMALGRPRPEPASPELAPATERTLA